MAGNRRFQSRCLREGSRLRHIVNTGGVGLNTERYEQHYRLIGDSICLVVGRFAGRPWSACAVIAA
jgi:hypothetical protein